MNDLDKARHAVMLAGAYLLCAREAYGGRLTASESHSLDFADDEFNRALKIWKSTHDQRS